MNIIYTLVGDKDPPEEIYKEVRKLVNILRNHSFKLRTNGDAGVSSVAIEAAYEFEIFLPWKHYNNYASLGEPYISKVAYQIAEHFCPKWSLKTTNLKKLLARNVQALLGKDCNMNHRSDFMIYYTKDENKGFIKHMLDICKHYEIPTVNMLEDNYQLKIARLAKINRKEFL